MENVILFLPPQVVVAPLFVVVHQQNLSGFETVFEIFVHCLIIHIEKITNVILTSESHG